MVKLRAYFSLTHHCRRKASMALMLERKNAGVQERDGRDKLELKASWAGGGLHWQAICWVAV